MWHVCVVGRGIQGLVGKCEWERMFGKPTGRWERNLCILGRIVGNALPDLMRLRILTCAFVNTVIKF